MLYERQMLDVYYNQDTTKVTVPENNTVSTYDPELDDLPF
jgi:hypothetical protein